MGSCGDDPKLQGLTTEPAQHLRALPRLASGRAEEPTAAIMDSLTLRSTPESGTCAGHDGAKRRRGSKVPMAVDTLGHPLALPVTPPTSRTQPLRPPQMLPRSRGSRCTPLNCRRQNADSSCCRDAGSWNDPSPGQRYRRLVRDHERYAATLAGFHVIAFIGYMIKQAAERMRTA
jgi:hypothetical protein